jgi:hypothetical protein
MGMVITLIGNRTWVARTVGRKLPTELSRWRKYAFFYETYEEPVKKVENTSCIAKKQWSADTWYFG